MTSFCGTALRRVLGVATAVAALLAVPNLASAQEQEFGFAGALRIPGKPLVSFDISWVDTAMNLYFLADRSNTSVDIIPIENNPPVFQIIPKGTAAFAGAPGVKFPCEAGAGPNDCAGPNGVITIFNTARNERELVVGDGPTSNPVCGAHPFCSTVKVFAGSDAHLVTTINTGGAARADELCFDPKDHLILVANDADHPPFVSFISTDTGAVVNQIAFPNATNGIEQCQWRGANQSFYLNIPEVSGPGDDSVAGEVVRISAAGQILDTFTIPVGQCAGPQGMAIGPDDQILLGCNAPTSINGGTLNGPQNSVIIDANTGAITNVLDDLGGSDQVWFDPGSGHYFLANGSHLPSEELGVVDAGPPVEVDQTIFVGFAGSTTRRAHSVAAWTGDISGIGNLTVAFLPVPPVGGTPAPFSSLLCDDAASAGCVGVFHTQATTFPVPPSEAGE